MGIVQSLTESFKNVSVTLLRASSLLKEFNSETALLWINHYPVDNIEDITWPRRDTNFIFECCLSISHE